MRGARTRRPPARRRSRRASTAPAPASRSSRPRTSAGAARSCPATSRRARSGRRRRARSRTRRRSPRPGGSPPPAPGSRRAARPHALRRVGKPVELEAPVAVALVGDELREPRGVCVGDLRGVHRRSVLSAPARAAPTGSAGGRRPRPGRPRPSRAAGTPRAGARPASGRSRRSPACTTLLSWKAMTPPRRRPRGRSARRCSAASLVCSPSIRHSAGGPGSSSTG